MPTLTINGRQVSVDDSFLNLPREEQDATVDEIAKSLPAQEPSGAVAGAKHGVAQVAHGIAETAKQNFGLGDGYDNRDPNYVPADPYKPSQWGQLLTENIPSIGTAIIGGKAAAAMAPGAWKIPAALAGAAGAGWLMSSGDTIKERAANNGHETPTTEDKIIGNLTSGAASAAGAIPATRLVPGLSKITGAGASAAMNALTRAGTTAASGVVGGAASDLANQVGTTAGTDQGLTVDPSRLGGAAITGGVTSGALAGAPLAGDLARSASLRKFVGDNEAASKNYATRLEAAGNGDLGNAKVDESSHQRVVGDLKTELADSAKLVRNQTSLSPEAENTLSALQRGEKVNPDEISRLDSETAGAPDGANTALLARTLHVAGMAGERGGHSNRGWAGGMSGVMDKNLGFLLNPARLAGGAAATALGMHLLGTSNPLFGGALAGTYGATRLVDNLTGMRSPAKTFAEHFADRNAQLRVPPSTPSAPPPPGGGAQGPWGPRPLPQQSVPQAGVQQRPPITPGSMPWQNPQIGKRASQLVSAAKALQKYTGADVAEKEQAQAEAQAQRDEKAKAKAEAQAKTATERAQALAERAHVKAAAAAVKAEQVKQREEAKAELAKAKVAAKAESDKVKAAAAKVRATKVTAEPKAAPEAPTAPDYEPLPEEHLYPKGISPKEYAELEASGKGTTSETYKIKAEASERRRQNTARDLKAKFPKDAHVIDWLQRELQRVGTNPAEITRAVKYAQDNVHDNVAKELEAFK